MHKQIDSSAWARVDHPVIDYGEGVYLYDKTGKQYIDGSSGPAAFSLGHGNREVNEAVRQQLDKIAHGYRGFYTSDAMLELQSIMARKAGGDLTASVLVSGGSEAIEACMKIAIQYQNAVGEPSRKRFIARHRSYHGGTLGALSLSGFTSRTKPFVGSLLPVGRVSAANEYRPPVGVDRENLSQFLADELEREILYSGPENVCAFVFEPVVGAAGGGVPAPPGYARKVKEVCEKYGVLLIADEIMCGTGRTGSWRTLEHDGVYPDIMAIAKGLGAGYLPLGAALFRGDMLDAIYDDNGALLAGYTFSNHTAACAAGVAVQKILEREKLVEKVAERGPRLFDQFRQSLSDNRYIGDIRGRGFLVGIELVEDRETKKPFDGTRGLADALRSCAFENGLLILPLVGSVDGKNGDTVVISPPFTANDDELEEIIEKFSTSVNQALRTIGAKL